MDDRGEDMKMTEIIGKRMTNSVFITQNLIILFGVQKK